MVNVVHDKTSTPLYDELRPRHQSFVDSYLVHFTGKRAAIECGYSTASAAGFASKLLATEEVQAAIEEGITLRRAEAEQSRQAIIDKLMIMSTVTLAELTVYDKAKNKLRILFPHEVDKELHPALQLVAYTREGNCEFRGAIQQKAIAQLASLMLWDKQQRDDNPAVQYSFTQLKPDG